MIDKSSGFNFPADINLKNPPLAEAWLEIRWKLEQFGPVPNLLRDPAFPFALGILNNKIKGRLSFRKDLAASTAPQDMLPYVVRHQYRPEEDGWPIIQLGPGVATTNFTSPYTWNDFKELSLFLRSVLEEAYQEGGIDISGVILRYRNAHDCNYDSENLFTFLKDNLNTSIELPPYIPGFPGSKEIPTSSNIVFTFDLKNPVSTGTLRLSTGTRNKDQSKVVISQLEIASGGSDVPDFADENSFGDWLDAAHRVIHEWFFASINGPLKVLYGVEDE